MTVQIKCGGDISCGLSGHRLLACVISMLLRNGVCTETVHMFCIAGCFLCLINKILLCIDHAFEKLDWLMHLKKSLNHDENEYT